MLFDGKFTVENICKELDKNNINYGLVNYHGTEAIWISKDLMIFGTAWQVREHYEEVYAYKWDDEEEYFIDIPMFLDELIKMIKMKLI